VPARAVFAPGFGWTHLDLIEHGALARPEVRRALALATPRDTIIAQVLGGHGRICDGDQAPGTAAYDPTLHNSNRYDIAAARTLLRRAGLLPPPHQKGRTGPRLTVNLWGDSACPTCMATLRLVARGWSAAGVATRLRLVPSQTLFGARGPLYSPTRFQSPQYDAVMYTWVNGPDPDDSAYWMRNALVTPAHPLGGNFDGYANTRVDALATRAVVTPNGPGRYALYRQIQRILTVDEPDVFLYWADTVAVVPERLSGYAPNPYAPAATWNAAQWAMTR
jgi:peptide/nickel transport system substrate-binding protein